MYQLLAALPNNRLASATLTNSINIWDINTGASLAELQGHKRPVEALTVFQDSLLVSGASDGTIRFWDIESYLEVGQIGSLEDANFEGQAAPVMIRSIDDAARFEGFSPFAPGPALISSLLALPTGHLAFSPDLTIRLFNVALGLEVTRLRGHTDRIHTLASLPNGTLASGSADKTIRLWDIPGGAEIGCLVGHRDWVNSILALPDDRLVSSSRDGTIRVWDARCSKEIMCFTLGETNSNDELIFDASRVDGGFTSIAMLPDGRLVSGGVDETVRIWNVDNGTEEGRLGAPTKNNLLLDVRGATSVLNKRRFMSIVVLNDNRIATGAWNRESRIPRQLFEMSLDVAPNETIRIWDVKSNAELWHRRDPDRVFMSESLYCKSAPIAVPVLRVRNTSLPELNYEFTLSPKVLQSGEEQKRPGSVFDTETPALRKGQAVEAQRSPSYPISIEELSLRYQSEAIATTDVLNLSTIWKLGEPRVIPVADAVSCSVFAPTALRSFAHAMIQVFLHDTDDGVRVAMIAFQLDPGAGRQITRDLKVKLMQGQVVEVHLELAGLKLSSGNPRRRQVIWNGQPESVNFEIVAPWSLIGRSVFPSVQIAVDGIVIGSITFRVNVGLFKRSSAADFNGNARQYRRAFLSHSSADRGEVLKRAQALKLAGIEFFQDAIHLQPGERWNARLLAELEKADVVYLFWSRSAKQSRWVMQEVRLALKRQRSSPSRLPDIIPVILEVPPPQPPRFLSHLHFNDPLAPALALHAANVRVSGD